MLAGKTVLITGGSRGIGQAIALRFAAEGASIIVLTKDTPESIQALCQQIEKSLVLDVDVCDQAALKRAVDLAVERFGGVDILVNNTSATCFTNTENTLPEKFDLMIGTSVRAAFFLSQACLPYLKKSKNPQIINISPPINLEAHWFKDHLGFSLCKYAMSLCTLGMAEEFKEFGIAVNSLWPESTVATQTIKDHFSPKVFAGSRWPSIMADAAIELVKKGCTGKFFTDEELLREAGVEDFSQYTVDPTVPLMRALFVSPESKMKPISQDLFLSRN